MADILIRGMSMPKYTTKAEFGIDADGNPLCMVYHEDGTEPDIYDVVPLPAGHGRIVDASVAEKKIKEMYMTMVNSRSEGSTEVAFGLHLAASIIRTDTNVPTIVPAEGGGEE